MVKRDRKVATLIFLFGSERSGKTTFLKQMRLDKGAEFNHEELLKFREAIYNNITSYESVKYYFDNIHRIGQLNYLPHNQDILYTHKDRSTEKLHFVLRDSPYIVAEFCGWHYLSQNHLFTINNAILCIVGSSDYDRIWECGDFKYNCLVQFLHKFGSLCNQNRFLNDIILFFNKMDLLAEKVQTADIRKHFPEFQGDPHSLEDVQEFLIQSFKKRTGNYSRPVFYHMITAVDIENFCDVFKTVEDTVMRRNLNGFPIL